MPPSLSSTAIPAININITYAFVHSSVTAEDPTGNQPGSSIHITNSSPEPENNGTIYCTVDFQWRAFVASFECDFDPATGNFLKFKLNGDSVGGGMEDVQNVEIGINERGVSDDNGKYFFLAIWFDFGCSGYLSNYGKGCGKKVLPRQEEGGWELSKDERERLGLRRKLWSSCWIERW